MMPGPVPKRSEERVRRNKDGETEKITAIGSVPAPELDIEDPHPMIEDFYEALKTSAQARYYEPSDWQFARLTLHFANKLVQSGRPSSQMLAAVNTMLTNLLVTEGDRRRVRLEVEREQAKAEVVDIAAELARRQSM